MHIVWVGIVAGLAGLNVWGTRRVLRDTTLAAPQRWGQLGLIWLLPLAGAMLALHLGSGALSQASKAGVPEIDDDWASGFCEAGDARAESNDGD